MLSSCYLVQLDTLKLTPSFISHWKNNIGHSVFSFACLMRSCFFLISTSYANENMRSCNEVPLHKQLTLSGCTEIRHILCNVVRSTHRCTKRRYTIVGGRTGVISDNVW